MCFKGFHSVLLDPTWFAFIKPIKHRVHTTVKLIYAATLNLSDICYTSMYTHISITNVIQCVLAAFKKVPEDDAIGQKHVGAIINCTILYIVSI
jgi:hypothetical protein